MRFISTPRTLQDHVHGNIPYSEEEHRVMNHPLMLRLHFVAQNDLKRLVFPGSTSTRFAHACGVMHLANQIIEAVFEGSERDVRNGPALNYAYPFHKLSDALIRKIVRIARFAGLIHDMGHGPLSHAFEPFFPKTGEFVTLLNSSGFQSLEPYRHALLKGDEHGRITHEALSCICFAIIARDVGIDTETVRAVTAVLMREPYHQTSSKLAPWIPFITSVVSSAPADADRMDYLLRDSMTTGVPYGLYSTDRILKSALCVWMPDGSYKIGWRATGLPAIVGLVQARASMFQQVYFHKTAVATKLMLKELASAAEHVEKLIDPSSEKTFVRTFSQLTDDSFLRTLESSLLAKPAQEVINDLLARRLWKLVYEQHPITGDVNAKIALQALETMYQAQQFRLFQLNVNPLKDLDGGAALVVKDADGYLRRFQGDNPWIIASPELHALSKTPSTIRRVYLISANPAVIEDVREFVLRRFPAKS